MTESNPTHIITTMQAITIRHTTTQTYEAWLPNGTHITYAAKIRRPAYQVTPQHLINAGHTARGLNPPHPHATPHPHRTTLNGQQVALRPDFFTRLLHK